jgi:ElaB/YqjD/DUF883 family membrane-anchored ribosome-binding protein
MNESVNGNGSNKKGDGIVVHHVEPGASSDAKAAALCSDIDRTRSQMAGTINELEERLSPARMKEQVLAQLHDAKERLKSEVREDVLDLKHSIHREIDDARQAMRDATIGRVEHMVQSAKGTINETGSTVMMTIRDNPIPALLTGIGITWLIMNARSQRAASNGHGIGVRRLDGDDMLDRGRGVLERGQRAVGEAVHTAQDATSRALHDASDAASDLIKKAGGAVHDAEARVGTLAHQAGETVGTLAHAAQDRAGQLAHEASERATTIARQTRIQAQRLEQNAEQVVQDNPLAVGAAAFALGAAVGLALPHTQREDEIIGATRDRLLKKAERLAEEAVGTARDRVEGLVHTMGGPGGA